MYTDFFFVSFLIQKSVDFLKVFVMCFMVNYRNVTLKRAARRKKCIEKWTLLDFYWNFLLKIVILSPESLDIPLSSHQNLN